MNAAARLTGVLVVVDDGDVVGELLVEVLLGLVVVELLLVVDVAEVLLVEVAEVVVVAAEVPA